MPKKEKAREQLLEEIAELRRQIEELKTIEQEHKRVEASLRESEEKYRALVESTDDSIYLIDRNYRYTFINKKHLARLGLPEEQLLGQVYGDFHSPDETRDFIRQVDRVFETGESVHQEHFSLRDLKYFLRTLSPVRRTDGEISAVTVVSKNISELKQMEERLYGLSITDEMTGLYNRRGFFTLAEQQLKLARRLKKGIYMLYADMDNLKLINDNFGHKEGDAALIEIAAILRENFRESDIIARIGGDEFVVVPIATTEDHLDTVIIRLRKALDDWNLRKELGYRLSLSVGISYFDPQNPCTIDELLAHGDKAMYEEKRTKKNQSGTV